MCIKAFHVSPYQYARCRVIKCDPGRVPDFQAALKRTNNVAAEERLNPHRPDGVPCRSTCLFVFATLAECSLYGSSQHKHETVHYYRVRTDAATKAPMTLVDQIRKQVEPTPAQVERMAREYWQPTEPWKFWEYLTDAIEIVDEIQPLDMGSLEVIGAQGFYIDDNDRAMEFCRAVMKA
jgi:hypothetical protein